MSSALTQSPAPGTLLIRHAGDSLTFILASDQPATGPAYLRTNLRQAARHRAELIAAIDDNIPPPGLDWEDVPMIPDATSGDETPPPARWKKCHISIRRKNL